jgi:hypothetical protein
MTDLMAAQRRHLVSSYAAVCHMLQQMEEAAAEGRSPSGVGSPLTPLDPGTAEPVLAPLRELRSRLRLAAEEAAPAELAEYEGPQTAHNTLVWLSNLLARMRMAVDDLVPTRMGRYGPLGAEENTWLAAIHAELFDRLQAARTAVDARLAVPEARRP